MRSILFIGNSFTARNDVPGMMLELAAAAGTPGSLDAEQVIAGGASLRRHWNSGRPQALLARKHYDDVVLQEQSTLPVKNPARYHENVRVVLPAIAEHGAHAWLYQTWARREEDGAQAVLDEAVRSIARETGASVVPVGDVWQQARAAGLDLYDRDGSHPNLAGSYLAACVFARVLGGVAVLQPAVGIGRGVAPALVQPIHAIASELPCK